MTHFILELMSGAWRKSLSFFYGMYTGQTLLIFLIMYIPFAVLPIQYILQRKKPGGATNAQMRFEKKKFRRNIFLMALVPLPIITLFYKTGFVTALIHTPRYFIALETVAIMLVHDAYFYRTHRMLHLPFFYKRFHRVHHASIHPTLYTALNFDFVELLINYSFIIRWELIMGALFGGLNYIPIFVLMTYTTIRNFYGHSGVELYGKKFAKSRLGKLIMSSSYHDIHHSKNDGNYSFFFTIWDRICSTVSLSYKEQMKKGE